MLIREGVRKKEFYLGFFLIVGGWGSRVLNLGGVLNKTGFFSDPFPNADMGGMAHC